MNDFNINFTQALQKPGTFDICIHTRTSARAHTNTNAVQNVPIIAENVIEDKLYK